MKRFHHITELVVTLVDSIGVFVVVVGVILAGCRFLGSFRGGEDEVSWRLCRRSLGRAVLLGLDFLVAGDIIRTVLAAHTLENVAVLGLIVLIRTFLTFALQMEMEGRWPWQPPPVTPGESPPD